MSFLSLDPSLRTRSEIRSIAPAPQLSNLTKVSLEAYMKALKTSGEGFQSMTAIHSSVMVERLMKFLIANKGKFTEQQINLVYQVARENKLIGNDDKNKDFKNLASLIQQISVNAFNPSKNVENVTVNTESQDDQESVLTPKESKKNTSSVFNTIKNRIQSIVPSPFFMKCAVAALAAIGGITVGIAAGLDYKKARDDSNEAQADLKNNVRAYTKLFDNNKGKVSVELNSANWINVGNACGEDLVELTYDFSPLLHLKGEELHKNIAVYSDDIDKIVSEEFPNRFAYEMRVKFADEGEEPRVNDWKLKNDANINGTENIENKEFPKSRADESKFEALVFGC